MLVTNMLAPYRNSSCSSASNTRPTASLPSPRYGDEDRQGPPEYHQLSRKRRRQGTHTRSGPSQRESLTNNPSEDDLRTLGRVDAAIKAVAEEIIDERLIEYAWDATDYTKGHRYALAFDLTTLAEIAANAGEQIVALLGDVFGLKGDTTELTEDIRNHTKMLVDHEDRLISVSKTIDAMDQTLKNFTITCKGIESKFDVEVKGLKIARDSLRERVKELEERVADVNATVDDLKIKSRKDLEDVKEQSAKAEKQNEDALVQVEERYKNNFAVFRSEMGQQLVDMEKQFETALAKVEKKHEAALAQADEKHYRKVELMMDQFFDDLPTLATKQDVADMEIKINHGITRRHSDTINTINNELKLHVSKIDNKLQYQASKLTKHCKECSNHVSEFCNDRINDLNNRIDRIEQSDTQVSYPIQPLYTTIQPTKRVSFSTLSTSSPEGRYPQTARHHSWAGINPTLLAQEDSSTRLYPPTARASPGQSHRSHLPAAQAPLGQSNSPHLPAVQAAHGHFNSLHPPTVQASQPQFYRSNYPPAQPLQQLSQFAQRPFEPSSMGMHANADQGNRSMYSPGIHEPNAVIGSPGAPARNAVEPSGT
jgi:hypothetical protein